MKNKKDRIRIEVSSKSEESDQEYIKFSFLESFIARKCCLIEYYIAIV